MRAVGFDGRPHGFFNYTRSRVAYKATVWHMDRFLTSLGYLDGSPPSKSGRSDLVIKPSNFRNPLSRRRISGCGRRWYPSRAVSKPSTR